MEKKKNFSRQREAILTYLKSTTCHPTAETILLEVRKDHPNVSLGTVYRNLAYLEEEGEILKLDLGDGISHFDGDISSHNHFLCRQCGTVIDIFSPVHVDYEAIKQTEEATIEGYHISFYGQCAKCKKR